MGLLHVVIPCTSDFVVLTIIFLEEQYILCFPIIIGWS